MFMNEIMLFIHVVAVVIAVGGMHYVAMIVGPTARRMNESGGGEFAATAHRKFRAVVWVCILLLLVSGLHLTFAQQLFKTPMASILTLKILLALVVFAISLGLTLPFKALAKFQEKRRLMLFVNLLVAFVVIYLGIYVSKR